MLDEPTSHLEVSSEEVVYEAIRQAKGGMAVLMATHRVVHLDWVDQILMMDEGRIVEEGTFAELVERMAFSLPCIQSKGSRSNKSACAQSCGTLAKAVFP